jgi:hypothetical protein
MAGQPGNWTPGSFESAYRLTRQSLHDDVVEKYAVIGSLLQYLQQYEAAGQHEENATTLLANLSHYPYADENVVRSTLWPKAPSAFGKLLQNSAPAIRKQYYWDCIQERSRVERVWKFTYCKPKQEEVRKEVHLFALLPQQKESLGQTVKRLRSKEKAAEDTSTS